MHIFSLLIFSYSAFIAIAYLTKWHNSVLAIRVLEIKYTSEILHFCSEFIENHSEVVGNNRIAHKVARLLLLYNNWFAWLVGWSQAMAKCRLVPTGRTTFGTCVPGCARVAVLICGLAVSFLAIFQAIGNGAWETLQLLFLAIPGDTFCHLSTSSLLGTCFSPAASTLSLLLVGAHWCILGGGIHWRSLSRNVAI